MDVVTGEFVAIYVIAIIIVDIITWKAKIQLKYRIVYAFAVTIIFLIFKYVLNIR
jgi:type IV secretory pathway VirB2 component (pilin)